MYSGEIQALLVWSAHDLYGTSCRVSCCDSKKNYHNGVDVPASQGDDVHMVSKSQRMQMQEINMNVSLKEATKKNNASHVAVWAKMGCTVDWKNNCEQVGNARNLIIMYQCWASMAITHGTPMGPLFKFVLRYTNRYEKSTQVGMLLVIGK